MMVVLGYAMLLVMALVVLYGILSFFPIGHQNDDVTVLDSAHIIRAMVNKQRKSNKEV